MPSSDTPARAASGSCRSPATAPIRRRRPRGFVSSTGSGAARPTTGRPRSSGCSRRSTPTLPGRARTQGCSCVRWNGTRGVTRACSCAGATSRTRSSKSPRTPARSPSRRSSNGSTSSRVAARRPGGSESFCERFRRAPRIRLARDPRAAPTERGERPRARRALAGLRGPGRAGARLESGGRARGRGQGDGHAPHAGGPRRASPGSPRESRRVRDSRVSGREQRRRPRRARLQRRRQGAPRAQRRRDARLAQRRREAARPCDEGVDVRAGGTAADRSDPSAGDRPRPAYRRPARQPPRAARPAHHRRRLLARSPARGDGRTQATRPHGLPTGKTVSSTVRGQAATGALFDRQGRRLITYGPDTAARVWNARSDCVARDTAVRRLGGDRPSRPLRRARRPRRRVQSLACRRSRARGRPRRPRRRAVQPGRPARGRGRRQRRRRRLAGGERQPDR